MRGLLIFFCNKLTKVKKRKVDSFVVAGLLVSSRHGPSKVIEECGVARKI